MYQLQTLHGDVYSNKNTATVEDLKKLIVTGCKLGEQLHSLMGELADTADAMECAGYHQEAVSLMGFWSSVKNAFRKVGKGIAKAAKWVGGKVKKAAKAIVGIIPGGKAAWNAAAGAVSEAKKGIKAVVGAIKGKGSGKGKKEEKSFENKVAAAKAYRDKKKASKATTTKTKASTPMQSVAPVAAGLASLLLLFLK